MIDFRSVTVTVFVKSKVDRYMQGFGFSEGGTKVFGDFQKLKYHTKSALGKRYYTKIIKHLLKHPAICYVNAGKYYGVESGVKMLSLGSSFVFTNDLVKQANNEGLVNIFESYGGKNEIQKETSGN